jgi:quercetin dioxygenase-like cupin family protein
MPTFKWSDLPQEPFEPPYSAAVGSVIRGEKIGVARVRYPAGAVVQRHASPHERVQAVMQGRMRFRVGDEERVLGRGEAVLVRPGTECSAEVLDDAEVFTFEDVAPAAAAARPAAGGPAFFRWAEMSVDFITPKYSSGRGAVITGERIEVAFMQYPGGTGGTPHSHPNAQIPVVLAGRWWGRIGDASHETGPGEVVLMPPNVEHEGRALEDRTVLNCKDIVPGWSVYHAGWVDPGARPR